MTAYQARHTSTNMKLNLVTTDSPFVTKLKAGTDHRRTMVMQGHYARNGADILCDSSEQLSELVNLCFWASIQAEEGRTVRGTICICSPDQAPRVRALHEPVVVSVSNLVALLTASPQSSLAVHMTEGGLKIWGVLDANPMFTLKLRVAGAGTVVASSGRDVLAVLERGEVYLPKSAGEIDWIVIVANALDKAKTFPDRMKLAARLQRVVTAMHWQGHGGALVVVPTSTREWEKSVAFAFRFDGTGSLAIRQRQLELEEAEERHENLERGQGGDTSLSLLPLYADSVSAHRDLLDSLLRSTGCLSAIDGAIVMDEELKVHGFGAKLQGEAEDFEVLLLDAMTGETDNVPYAKLGGTRHQSAARFVHQNPEAMVFVASQDGRLTLLVWVIDRGQVAAVRRLEHFIWESRA